MDVKGGGPTILVVDDDPELRELVGLALAREGYDVISAKDASEGLERATQSKPVVALLDVMMPGMSGLEMLTRLRQRDRGMSVIIMTAAATPDVALAALRDQACDFLAKPFDIRQLLSAVNTAFELRRQRMSIEVMSARPEWIELSVPCDLTAVDPLERLMTQLKTDLPPGTRRGIADAFRELLRNAIEHGGKDDPTQRVEIGYLRTKRFILYRIKDPVEAFAPDALSAVARPITGVADPADGPARHGGGEAGALPGGFDTLLACDMVDEITYNERHNEVILVKYIDGE